MNSLETKYGGRYYRSRLESRWAVLFDAMGAEVDYESRSFDVAGIWYTPDFYLDKLHMDIEIKPQVLNEANLARVMHMVKNWEGSNYAVICGDPVAGEHSVMVVCGPHLNHWQLAECRDCGKLAYVGDDETWGTLCCDHDRRKPLTNGTKLEKAFLLAMRYKFDHIEHDAAQIHIAPLYKRARRRAET